MRDKTRFQMGRRDFLRRAGTAAAGLSLAGLAAACGDGEPQAGDATTDAPSPGAETEPQASPSEELVQFTGSAGAIAWPLAPNSLPLFVAQNQGFLEDHGLDLEIVSFGSGAELVRAIDRNDMNLGVMALHPPMVAWEEDVRGFRCVGTSLWPQSLVFGVLPDSEIESPEDLVGRTVTDIGGGAGITHWLIDAMMQSAGHTIDDVTLVDMSSLSDTQTALLNGVVDCGVLLKPLSSQLTIDGEAEILWDPGVHLPDLIESGLWANNGLIEDQASVVQQYVDAFGEGQRFIRDNPDEVAEIWAEELEMRVEVVSDTLSPEFIEGYNIRLPSDGFEANKEAGVALGILTEEGINYEEFYVDRFAASAAEEYDL